MMLRQPTLSCSVHSSLALPSVSFFPQRKSYVPPRPSPTGVAQRSSFHIISNHSPRVNVLGNQLDYLGVVILMWGSTIPSVYYGYYCDPTLQKLYWTMVDVPHRNLETGGDADWAHRSLPLPLPVQQQRYIQAFARQRCARIAPQCTPDLACPFWSP